VKKRKLYTINSIMIFNLIEKIYTVKRFKDKNNVYDKQSTSVA